MIGLALGVPWLAALALCLLDGRRAWVGRAAVAALVASLGALAPLMHRALAGDPVVTTAGGWDPGVGITFRADALGVAFAIVSALVLVVALASQVSRGVESRVFPAMVLFMGAGLQGLFLTSDVFSFFVFFELSMIAGYVLTAYGGGAREVRGAFVFAVTNLLGSFIFLIGVAALYHVTGTLDMTQIAERMSGVGSSAAILIGVTFLIAFGLKLGLFPFHFWLPLVYTAARPPVVAILSGALANIGGYGLIRFGAGLLPRELEAASGALVAIGSLTIVYGSVQAISCRSTAEMLAYSSVGQVGYVLLALGVGGPAGLTAAVVYAIVNSLNKLLLFLSAGVRGWLVGGAFLVGALSVTGIPPSSGFLAKLAVIQAGVDAQSTALVAVIVLGSALSFVYMFQTFQRDHWEEHDRRRPPGTGGERALIAGVAGVVLALGLWPEPIMLAGSEAAGGLGAAP